MTLSQQDIDFLEEREARKNISSLIANIRGSVTSEKVPEAQIISLTKSLSKQHGLQEELIAWAEIRISNNKKYPTQNGIVPGLDSLAEIDNLIAEAGMQLKNVILDKVDN